MMLFSAFWTYCYFFSLQTFTPLVDKAGVGNFRLKTVEFLVDHRLEITDLGETKPYRVSTFT